MAAMEQMSVVLASRRTNGMGFRSSSMGVTSAIKASSRRKGNKKGDPKAALMVACSNLLLAASHKLQQEHEQVDEVEVERQRAHDRLAPCNGCVIGFEVHFLDPLRVVGRQARECKNADHGDCELKRGGLQED